MEEMIKNHLAPGAGVEEVTRFLDSRNIKHFGLDEGTEPVFAPSEAQMRPHFGKYILARIPDVRVSMLTAWDLYITFFFDEHETMTNYEVKEIGTGL